MRLSGLLKRNRRFRAMCCLLLQNGYLCVLKLVQHIPPKPWYLSTRPDDVNIPEGSDSSILRPSSVTVAECPQDKDNITGGTGQGQDRGAREEEEKDKQFAKWCQHEEF